ncbi:hypothetical protein [Actinomycetospora chibensis]|uniref:Uncharacterized protein n=1 Tax=Actinomycetospora chibensis TaxID=663606 RepID=A0ABV9RM00_9PSEU|nr:hypothetical protein [Actinomycetospora chibensis]MDD7926959.1 hypothetical protein [Actinomycetospora chibensis]
MPGSVVPLNAGVLCFHAATAAIGAGQTKVLLGGQPAATTENAINVTGPCPFTVPATPAKPQPCVTITWGSTSTKVTAGGKALLLGAPGTVPGVCQSAEKIPQGAPSLTAVQNKVSAL